MRRSQEIALIVGLVVLFLTARVHGQTSYEQYQEFQKQALPYALGLQQSSPFQLTENEKLGYYPLQEKLSVPHRKTVEQFQDYLYSLEVSSAERNRIEDEWYTKHNQGLADKVKEHLDAGLFTEAHIYQGLINTKEGDPQVWRQCYRTYAEAHITSYEFGLKWLTGAMDQLRQKTWPCKTKDGDKVVKVRIAWDGFKESDDSHPRDLYANRANPDGTGIYINRMSWWHTTGAQGRHYMSFFVRPYDRTIKMRLDHGLDWVVGLFGSWGPDYKHGYDYFIEKGGIPAALQQLEKSLKVKARSDYILFVSEENCNAVLYRRTRHSVFMVWLNVEMIYNHEEPLAPESVHDVRVMILWDLCNALLDFDSDNPMPEPQEEEPVLTLVARDSPQMAASGPEPSSCRLIARLSKGEDEPIPGVKLKFTKPEFGTLSRLEGTTNQEGRIPLLYTAPDVTVVKAQTPPEVKVRIEASGTVDDRPVADAKDIRVRVVEINGEPEQEIIPAHPSFYNKIAFTCDSLSDNTCEAKIRIAEGDGPHHGALVKQEGDEGGKKELEMWVTPGQEVAVWYHWTGPPELAKAKQEVIEVEIRRLTTEKELVCRQQFEFEVGIDISVESARRQWEGKRIAMPMPEAYVVTVKENFHPEKDLTELLERWNVRFHMNIEQTGHPDLKFDTEARQIFKSLVTYAGDWYSQRHGLDNAVIFDGAESEMLLWQPAPAKADAPTSDGEKTYEVVSHHESGQNVYPWICCRGLGMYTFQVDVVPMKHDQTFHKIDMQIDSNPANNSYSDLVTEITVPDKGREYCCCLCIAFEMWLRANFALKVPAAAVVGSISDASVNFANAIAHPDQWKTYVAKGVTDLYTMGVSFAAPAGKQDVFDFIPLAANYVGDFIEWQGRKFAQEHVKSTRLAAEDADAEVVVLSQAVLQAAPEYRFLVVEREGVTNFHATINGAEVKPIAKSPKAASGPTERMYIGENHTLIVAKRGEVVRLVLEGPGGKGRLRRFTADSVHAASYPKTAWECELADNGSGVPQVLSGQPLQFEAGPSLALEPHTKERPPSSPETSSPDFAGTWHTNFGTLRLTIEGDKAIGRFGESGGRIRGVLSSDATQLSGRWSEGPTYQPPDAGRFHFTLTSEGKAFAGLFGFGDQQPRMPWNGQRFD